MPTFAHRRGQCGAMARPHVLWFDESHDEPRYHLDTVRAAAARAALLVIAGTSIVDINVEANPFAEIAAESAGAIRALAGEVLPVLVRSLG